MSDPSHTIQIPQAFELYDGITIDVPGPCRLTLKRVYTHRQGDGPPEQVVEILASEPAGAAPAAEATENEPEKPDRKPRKPRVPQS